METNLKWVPWNEFGTALNKFRIAWNKFLELHSWPLRAIVVIQYLLFSLKLEVLLQIFNHK